MSDLPDSRVFDNRALEEGRQQLEARGLRLGMPLDSVRPPSAGPAWIDFRKKLECLDGYPGSKRKLRLVACLLCRTLWDRLEDDRSRQAVEVAERFADGRESQQTLQSIRVEAFFASRTANTQAARAAYFTTVDDAKLAAENASHCASFYNLEDLHAQGMQDLLGPQVRPLAIDPAWARWNNGTVPRMARTIYDEGRFEELAILADALEEASCTDQTILDHCRGPGPHFRGCWLVDLLAGRKGSTAAGSTSGT